MELQERLKVAQEAGQNYKEVASMFEAAITDDLVKLSQYRTNDSAGIRFSAFTNPRTEVSLSDLNSDPLLKYAAIYNPSSSTQILDHIGMNKTMVNPIIPEAIHTHANASKEFQVFRAITDFGLLDDQYNDDSEKYFTEAIYGDSGIDFEGLEALVYLSILNLIPAPMANTELWYEVLNTLKQSPKEATLSKLGKLPAIPGVITTSGVLVERWDTGSQVLRCIAAELTANAATLESLRWDDVTLNTSYPSEKWNCTRSPRNSIAQNENVGTDTLVELFQEESCKSEVFSKYPSGLLWRFCMNPNTSVEILNTIVTWIEDGLIQDRLLQKELLIGHTDDVALGLANHPALQGDLKKRINALLKVGI